MAYVALEASRPIEELPPPAVGEWVESKAAHQDAQIFKCVLLLLLLLHLGCTDTSQNRRNAALLLLLLLLSRLLAPAHCSCCCFCCCCRARVIERYRHPVHGWVFRLRSPDMASCYVEPLKASCTYTADCCR